MKTFLAVILSVCLVVPPVYADAPMEINYQGKLAFPDGTPRHGTFGIQFRILDDDNPGPPENVLYDSTHPNVTVTQGSFHVVLGAAPLASFPANLFAQYPNLYLEITVNGTTLAPRQKLVGSPYALSVAQNTVGTDEIIDLSVDTSDLADGAVTSGKILDGEIVNDDIAPGADISPGKINGGSFQNETYTFPNKITLSGGANLTGGTTGGANAIDFGPGDHDHLTAIHVSTLTAGAGSDADHLHTHPALVDDLHAATHDPLSGGDPVDDYYFSLHGSSKTVSTMHTFNPAVPGAPFVLGANAQGELIPGLNADRLDNRHAADFSVNTRALTAGTGLNITAGTGELTQDMTFSIHTSTVPRKNADESITGEWTFSNLADTNFPNGRWNTAGNVGIGTVSGLGTYRLNVNGRLNASRVCLENDSVPCRNVWPEDSPWVSGGGHIYYDSGNVGMGTNAPAYALDVDGDIRAESGLCLNNDCRTFWPWQMDAEGISFPSAIGNVGIGGTPVSGERLLVVGTMTVTGDMLAADFNGAGANVTNLEAGDFTTGILPITRGGTGVGSFAAGNRLITSNPAGDGFMASAVEENNIATITFAIGRYVNSNILELTGLTTSLTHAQGGTGANNMANARSNLLAVPTSRTVTGNASAGLAGGGDLSANRTISLNTSGLLSGCGDAISGKVYWDGDQFHCGADGNNSGAITGSGAQDLLAVWDGAMSLTSVSGLSLSGTTFTVPGDLVLTGTMDGAYIEDNTIDGSEIRYNTITPNDVSFNYAGSSSKGGAATGLSCSGACVSSSEVDFNYAAASSKGGAATDLACTGACVSSGEANFNYAQSDIKGGPALGLACTGACVSSFEADFNYAASNSKGGAATSISLSPAPALCPSGQYATGIDGSGNAVGCTGDATDDTVSAFELNGLFSSGVGILWRITSASYSTVADNSSSWNTAYNWGNHAGLYAPVDHTHAFLPLSGGLSNKVNGNLYAPRVVSADGSNQVRMFVNGSFNDLDSLNLPLSFNHSGSQDVLINASGNGYIGIGTSSPYRRLMVVSGHDEPFRVTYGGNLVFGGSTSGALTTFVLNRNVLVTHGFTVNGTASGSYKPFVIDHPLDKENKKLVHTALEGPEISVFYRGRAVLNKGKAQVILPTYFETLTRKNNRTVLLTCINGDSPLYVSKRVKNGEFEVQTTKDGNPSQEFYWEVKAVRADVEPLVVERDR